MKKPKKVFVTINRGVHKGKKAEFLMSDSAGNSVLKLPMGREIGPWQIGCNSDDYTVMK